MVNRSLRRTRFLHFVALYGYGVTFRVVFRLVCPLFILRFGLHPTAGNAESRIAVLSATQAGPTGLHRRHRRPFGLAISGWR
jgi:hypothetical protein